MYTGSRFKVNEKAFKIMLKYSHRIRNFPNFNLEFMIEN